MLPAVVYEMPTFLHYCFHTHSFIHSLTYILVFLSFFFYFDSFLHDLLIVMCLVFHFHPSFKF